MNTYGVILGIEKDGQACLDVLDIKSRDIIDQKNVFFYENSYSINVPQYEFNGRFYTKIKHILVQGETIEDVYQLLLCCVL